MGKEEFPRLQVNAKTFLPVRQQLISTAFPEFGSEVVRMEWEFVEFGIAFDHALFEIEPTDSEMEKFGLVREDLADLPLNPTAIEIKGDEGLRFVGTINDDRGKREIAGALPTILLEAPAGDMFIDIRTEDGEQAWFQIFIGGSDMGTVSERMVIYLGEGGDERGISAVTLETEDIGAFMKRKR